MGNKLWISISVFLLLQGLAQASDLSEYLYATATVKFHAHDISGSLQDLSTAASEDPTNPDIFLLMGRVLLQIKETSKATVALQKAAELDPAGADAYFFWALACSESGELERALDLFGKARSLDPSLEQVCLYKEGMILLQLNSRSLAQERFEEARRVNPDSAYGRSAREYQRLSELKRLHLFVSTGIEWDSNVILKPEESSLHLHLPKKSDWVVPIVVSADYCPLITDKATVGVRYSFYQDLHFRLHDWDVTDNSGEVYALYHWGPLYIRPHYRYDFTHLGLDPFSQIHEGGLNLFIPEASCLTFQPFYRYQYRDFLYPIDSPNDRDGSFHQAGAYQYLFFSNQKSFVRLGGLYERDFSEGRNFDEQGGRALAGFHILLPLSIYFSGEGEYGRLFFPNSNTFFHRHRTDTVYSYHVQVRKEIIEGLSVSLRFAHTINNSTIEDFEYHRTISSLFFSWNF